MIESLLEAIRQGQFWLDRFNRYNYREAFTEYGKRYAERYEQALTTEEADALAKKLLDALACSWRKEHFWNRPSVRVNDKMVIVSYLTPMLLTHGEKCRSLAGALCDEWNCRYPKDTYRTAEYQRILKGFRHAILGIDLEQKHIDEDE